MLELLPTITNIDKLDSEGFTAVTRAVRDLTGRCMRVSEQLCSVWAATKIS